MLRTSEGRGEKYAKLLHPTMDGMGNTQDILSMEMRDRKAVSTTPVM